MIVKTMITERISLALLAAFPVLCTGQTSAPASAITPTVFTNPRAPSDDPRIGLKGGLYDAAEAASGLQKIATLPKPPGFAPGNMVGGPPPPPDPLPGEPAPTGPPAAQYG